MAHQGQNNTTEIPDQYPGIPNDLKIDGHERCDPLSKYNTNPLFWKPETVGHTRG